MDLIDRDALKKVWLEECGGDCAICGYLITEKSKDGLTDWIGCELIENAPKIETFTFDDMNKAQEVGYKAGKLEGKSERPHGITNAELFKQIFGIYATELWTMTNAKFTEWLNADMREEDSSL